MKWFRFYTEALHDPKVQQLPGDLFKVWVSILCLASRYGGEIPVAAVPHHLSHRSDRAVREINDLIRRGLLVYGGGLIIPHNWHGRQYKSDLSTERVRRFRTRSMKRFRNVSNETHETAPEKKVSKKERERASKWVADLEARLAAETQSANVTSLDALRNLTPLTKWRE